jgi:hypothetical protein
LYQSVAGKLLIDAAIPSGADFTPAPFLHTPLASMCPTENEVKKILPRIPKEPKKPKNAQTAKRSFSMQPVHVLTGKEKDEWLTRWR